MPIYYVKRDDSTVLDAKVNVNGSSVSLHSRGGATGGRPPRNTMYEAALDLICTRARKGENRIDRILIDSIPARKLPESQRVLLRRSEIDALKDDDLVSTIRRGLRKFGQPDGVKGGNSTKQVRFDLSLDNPIELLGLVAESDTHNFARLVDPQTIRSLNRPELEAAIDRLLRREVEHDFNYITDYSVLLDDGSRLPPKAVVGVALMEKLGRKVGWRDFRGGDRTPAFDALRNAGFEIVHVRADAPDDLSAVKEALDKLAPSEEDRKFAEGSLKRVAHLRRERNPKLGQAKRAAVLAMHGRLICEDCGEDLVGKYSSEVAEGCFEVHHSAVQVQDMSEEHESTIDDVRLLCANCHRAEHRRMKLGLAHSSNP